MADEVGEIESLVVEGSIDEFDETTSLDAEIAAEDGVSVEKWPMVYLRDLPRLGCG